MTRQEYLEALGAALSTLVPDRERSDILRYYKEYFEEAGPEREAELMEELGSPEDLARKIAREGGFSGGGEETGPKRHPNWWKWAAGIAAAVVLVLAGTFAALSAFNAYLWDQANEPSGPVSVPPSGGVTSIAPASPSPATETQPVGESQQPSQAPSDPAAVTDFVRLDIEIALGDVTVRPGADWGLTLESSGQDRYGEDYLFHYTLEDQKLTIWSTPRNLESNGDSDIEGQVVVTVPKGWTLERVDIKNGTGDTQMEAVTVDETAVDSGTGGIEVGFLRSGDIHLTSGTGDIRVQGYVGPTTNLETGTGDVEVSTYSRYEDCAYTLESGTGDIRLDGMYFEEPQRKTDGSLSLTVISGTGDITVDFGG